MNIAPTEVLAGAPFDADPLVLAKRIAPFIGWEIYAAGEGLDVLPESMRERAQRSGFLLSGLDPDLFDNDRDWPGGESLHVVWLDGDTERRLHHVAARIVSRCNRFAHRQGNVLVFDVTGYSTFGEFVEWLLTRGVPDSVRVSGRLNGTVVTLTGDAADIDHLERLWCGAEAPGDRWSFLPSTYMPDSRRPEEFGE